MESNIAMSVRSSCPLASLQNVDGGTYVASASYPISVQEEEASPSSFWNRTQTFHRWLKDPKVFKDALSDWGMLAYISEPSSPSSTPVKPTGMETFLRSKIGLPRKGTFEISNLGSVHLLPPSPDQSLKDDDRWNPTQVIFTQAPLPLSAAVVCSFVGCEELGGMSVGVGWEEGVVSKDQMEEVVNRLNQVIGREIDGK